MAAGTQESPGNTAVEIAGLRGDLGTAMAEIRGSLLLLVHRTDQTDRALGEARDQATLLDKRVDALEVVTAAVPKNSDRLAALERWMWLALGVSLALGTVGGWIASNIH